MHVIDCCERGGASQPQPDVTHVAKCGVNGIDLHWFPPLETVHFLALSDSPLGILRQRPYASDAGREMSQMPVSQHPAN